MSQRIPGPLAWTLADQVGLLSVVLTEASAKALAKHRVTGGELVALAILVGYADGLSQSDLARHMGVSRQRAHIITRKLVRRGFLSSKRGGREAMVKLADKGRAFVKAERPGVERALAEVLQPLTAKEAQTLSQLLSRVAPLPE